MGNAETLTNALMQRCWGDEDKKATWTDAAQAAPLHGGVFGLAGPPPTHALAASVLGWIVPPDLFMDYIELVHGICRAFLARRSLEAVRGWQIHDDGMFCESGLLGLLRLGARADVRALLYENLHDHLDKNLLAQLQGALPIPGSGLLAASLLGKAEELAARLDAQHCAASDTDGTNVCYAPDALDTKRLHGRDARSST